MFFALGSSRLHLQGCQVQRPQSLLPPFLIDSVGRKRGPSSSPPPLSSSTVDMETRQGWEEKRGGGGSVSTSVIKNTCLMPPSSSSQRAGDRGWKARREAEAVLFPCSSALVPFFFLFPGPGFRSSTCGTLVVVYSTMLRYLFRAMLRGISLSSLSHSVGVTLCGVCSILSKALSGQLASSALSTPFYCDARYHTVPFTTCNRKRYAFLFYDFRKKKVFFAVNGNSSRSDNKPNRQR